jgi:hypothetical protein
MVKRKNKYKTEFWTVDDGSEGELEHEEVHRAVMAWLEDTPAQEWPTRLELIGHKYKPADESDFTPSGEKATIVVRAWVKKHRPKWLEAMDMCKTATRLSARLLKLRSKVSNNPTLPVYEIEHELRELASKLSEISRAS